MGPCSASSLQCDERVEDLYLWRKTEGIWFVQPQDKRAQGYLIAVFHYPKGSYKEGGGTLFTQGIVNGRGVHSSNFFSMRNFKCQSELPKEAAEPTFNFLTLGLTGSWITNPLLHSQKEALSTWAFLWFCSDESSQPNPSTSSRTTGRYQDHEGQKEYLICSDNCVSDVKKGCERTSQIHTKSVHVKTEVANHVRAMQKRA